MEAFEFQTIVKDGIIRVPEKFTKRLAKNIKVIILTEKEKTTADSPAFPYFAVDTDGYVFDREEANER
ncbi:MAG: hypothetical protein FWG70_09875 [Oscillospiraceae bacterium]|nr:hypothetical protein [Oscillospiraceae bacterium]